MAVSPAPQGRPRHAGGRLWALWALWALAMLGMAATCWLHQLLARPAAR
jgi:hypothetical protein